MTIYSKQTATIYYRTTFQGKPMISKFVSNLSETPKNDVEFYALRARLQVEAEQLCRDLGEDFGGLVDEQTYLEYEARRKAMRTENQ